MEPITISMRGLAEVACAKPSQKQSKLKRFKFPESEESVGRSNYYVWAISAIKHHHRGESEFVDDTLHRLSEEAARVFVIPPLNGLRADRFYRN